MESKKFLGKHLKRQKKSFKFIEIGHGMLFSSVKADPLKTFQKAGSGQIFFKGKQWSSHGVIVNETCFISDAFLDLVPFAQSKKHEKHP